MQALAVRVIRLSEAVSTALGYLSGGAFLLLSFYMSWDVLGRKFGFPYSGVSDELSGYTLAIAGSLGLAYALNVGAHVRIEVISELLPAGLRRVLYYFSVFTMGVFAALLAYYSWRLTAGSAAIHATSISILRAPIAVPQGLMAAGFTMLAVQAAIIVFLRPISGLGDPLDGNDDAASGANI